MRKFTNLAVAALAALAMAVPASAAMPTFEEAVASRGADAQKYETQVEVGGETITVISVEAMEGACFTETHVRELPMADPAKPLTVISEPNRVKVWGITDNGWTRVYVIDDDGNPRFGWIKADLLNPRGSAEADAASEAAAQTEAQAAQTETQQAEQAATAQAEVTP